MFIQFAKDLLREKGINGLDKDVYEGLVDEVSTIASQLVNKRIIDSMTDEQMNEFNKLIGSKPSESEVQKFIDSNVANKHFIAAEALLEFKEMYLVSR